jgi:hypothetical protein
MILMIEIIYFCGVLRWWRQSGDKYNLGAQFVNNYRRVIKLINTEFNVGSVEQCVQQLE